MDGQAVSVLGPIWLTLGATIFVAAWRAGHSDRALRVGCYAVSVLWVLAGALVNAGFLLAGSDYSGFADAAYVPSVTETWEALVVPHPHFFIGLLVAFEAIAGVLVLFPGQLRQGALVALIAFTVALVSFGWGFYLWAVPMTTALALLLQAERRRATTTADQPQLAHAP
jgi:uncharacterized membrane protein YphA (DoxX/SURF4 family)